jgi:hypothetical protein
MIYNGTYATPRADLGAAYQEYMEQLGTFIATLVAPELPVPFKKATYPARTRESILKVADVKRAATGGYNRINMQAEDKSYECEAYGLEQPIDYSQRAFYANDFDLEVAGAEELSFKVKLAREIRTAAALFDTAVWTGAALYTDHSGAPWDDAANGKPISDVNAAKLKVYQSTGVWPDSLILGGTQMQNLLVSAQILARFPGASEVSEEQVRQSLQRIFGLKNIFVGYAPKDTADEGQDASVSEVWGDDYAMVCKVAAQGAPVNEMCVARSPRWTVESPAELVFDQYYEAQTRKDVLRARHDVDELVQDKFMGHLMKVDA